MTKKVIIDTSVLLSLYYLNLLPHLFNLYEEILVPEKVEQEFILKADLQEQDARIRVLSYLYEQKLFLKCTNTDITASQLLTMSKGLGVGEIAVISQSIALGGDFILILDDKEARKQAKNFSQTIQGTLYVLALMDLKLRVCEYDKVLELLREKLNFRFSKKIAQEAYKKAMRDLNL